MYSNEKKAIILATQARKLGIIAIVTLIIFILPVSLICCIDGYYKAKKAKTLAPENSIVKSAYLIVNIARWGLIILFIAILIIGGRISFFYQ